MDIKDSLEYQISNIVLSMQESFTALDIASKLKPIGFFLDPITIKNHLSKLVDNGILTQRPNGYEVNR